MKKLVTVTIVTIVVLMSVLSVSTKAATLDRGVSIGQMFVAGGASNGNPMIVQLKYQMAVDSKVGIKNRYTTNVYHSYFYDSHNTSTTTVSYDSHESYDSHDTVISVNADIGEGEVTLNTNPITYKDKASPTVISVDAEIGKGEITLNTK